MKATRETYNWVKQIVEENKKDKWYDSSAMDKENASFLSLKYELENGRKLYRSYYVGQAELEEKNSSGDRGRTVPAGNVHE